MKLVIVGAGGFGREVLWLAERMNQKEAVWEILGFVDDNAKAQGTLLNGYPVLGTIDSLKDAKEDIWVACAIGSSATRKSIVQRLSGNHHIHFATLIDPSVLLSDSVQIGEGCIICAGAVLTVNIRVGNHVIINLNTTVGHDAVVEDFVTVYPNANISGNVTVGELSEIGTGTEIIQGKTITKNVILGAGSVVIRDVLEEGTYVGVPIKKVH